MKCPCGKRLNAATCLWVDEEPTGFCDDKCYGQHRSVPAAKAVDRLQTNRKDTT